MPTILIVEDEPTVRAYFVRAVTRLAPNTVVFAAESAGEAWALYQAHGADLVLSDYRLPDRSGLDLMQALRARDPAQPFVLISADTAIAATALAMGANRFLAKPVGLPELAEVFKLLPP